MGEFLKKTAVFWSFLIVLCAFIGNIAWGASEGKGVPPQVQLKLIWIQKFDSVPSNEKSILNKPPEISSGMIPSILETKNKLLFFDEEGKIVKTLEFDSEKFEGAEFSKHRNYVTIRKTVGDIPETEAPIPAIVQVFDKEGNLKYEITEGDTDNTYIVSDKGYCLEISHMDTSFTLYGEIGKEICHKQPIISESNAVYENRFYGMFSSDGGKIIIFATHFPYRGKAKVYFIIYDTAGNELWRKEVVEEFLSEDFEISDLGDRIISSSYKDGEPSVTRADLLDGDGNILKTIPGICGSVKFSSALNSFVFYSGTEINVVNVEGAVTTMNASFDALDTATSTKFIASVGMREKGNNVVLSLFNTNGELLLNRNLGGSKKDLEQLYVNFVEDDVISIQFSNEVRYFRILRK